MNILTMSSICTILSFVVAQVCATNVCLAQDSDGVVMKRIRSDRTLQHYHEEAGPSGRELVSRLDKYSKVTGKLPSRTETIRILSESNVSLTQLERLWFETIVRKIQQPKLSSETIYRMYQTYSESIPPMNCSYQVVTSPGGPGDLSGQTSTTKAHYQFSHTGGKTAFLSQSDGFQDARMKRQTCIYNGIDIRKIDEVSGGGAIEYVGAATTLKPLYPEHHPMTNARTSPLESASDPNAKQESGFSVFSNPETYIFETTETVGNRECVVAGALTWAIFLDPSVGYSIVEERFGDIEFSEKYSRSSLHHRKQNSDFVELAEGGFLPRRSLIEQWRDTAVMRKVEVIVDSLEVSPKVSFETAYKRPAHLYVVNELTGEGGVKRTSD